MVFEFSDCVLDEVRLAHRARNHLHLQSVFHKGLESFHPSRLLTSLMQHSTPSEVMQLAHKGEPIDSQRLLSNGRVDGARLSRYMNDGAALLLIGLQDWVDGLDPLKRALAEVLKVDVSVNAYIGGPSSQGFLEHVDHHDVLVVQLEGEKDWRLWEPTLQEPIDLPRHQQGIPTKSLATLRLSRGDVLFVPRGVWHAAQGTETAATAHLSFGLQPLTALHWLSSMRTELMDELIWRQEIPEERDERVKWLCSIRDSLSREFTDENLLRYLRTRADRYHKES